MSIRLQQVLESIGVKRLGDVEGLTDGKLLRVRNCGKGCVRELRALLARADLGEFDPPSESFSPRESADLLCSLERLLAQVNPRDRGIIRAHFDRSRPTLEQTGQKHLLTRERIRQILQVRLHQIWRQGGPRFAAQVSGLASLCQRRGRLLKPALLSNWLGRKALALRHPLDFYVRLLIELQHAELP